MITSLVLAITTLTARDAAASTLKNCQATHRDAIQQCTKAKEAAGTAEQSASDGAAANFARNQGQSNGGAQLSGASSAALAAINDAKSTCADQKKRCDQDCDPGSAQPAKDKSNIQKEKQQCDDEIKAQQDILDAAGQQKKSGQDGGDKTKDAAQGSPQSPNSDKKDDGDKTTPASASTPDKTDTASTGSAAATLPAALAGTAGASGASCPGTERDYLNEDCVGELTARCKGNASDTQCQLFNQRYCGGGASGGGGGTGTSGATLNQGAGLSASDGYCQAQNASAFCNASTSQCPSCCAQYNSCGQTVTQNCSADPSYLPTLTPASTSVSGGGGTMGGGGASGGSALGTTATLDGPAKTGAVPESAESKLLNKMNMGAASGGGGSGGAAAPAAEEGGSPSPVSDFLAGYGIDLGRKPAKADAEAGSAPVLAASVKDVTPDRAADVFKIQSLVLKARCDAGLQLNCPPRN